MADGKPDTALKLGVVYRCVAMLSNLMGEIPVAVHSWDTMQDVSDHPLGRLLWQRPNEAMSPYTYKALLEARRHLYGNAYAYIHRDGDGIPMELIPMHPDTVRIYRNSAGRIWYGCTDGNGKQWELNPMQVLHYKGYSRNGLYGVSTLYHASQTLRTAQLREEFDQAVYRNGGRPSGILRTDVSLSTRCSTPMPDGNTIMETHRDVVRREWERVHGGAENVFRTAILDNGLDFKPLSITQTDAQFIEAKEMSILDICRFFGVPPHKVYAGDQNYNSNEQQSIDFLTDTIQPTVTLYEEEDLWKLLTPDEVANRLTVRRNMNVMLRSNTDARGNWYKRMRDIGAYSVNDILRFEHLPSVPGGDVRLASLNYVPLEDFSRLSVIRNGGAPKE